MCFSILYISVQGKKTLKKVTPSTHSTLNKLNFQKIRRKISLDLNW